MHRRAMLSLTATAFSAAAAAVRPAPAAAANLTALPVTFDNAGARLAGSLYLPSRAPAGGLVLVHGNGPRRRLDGLARTFSAGGFAVLTYDKRGVGASGGVYEELNNTTPENLALLAGDAAGAMSLLRSRQEVAGLRLGYFGVSQAGWVVPLAMAQAPRADFMAFWSAPACTVAEQAEAGMGAGGVVDEKLARQFIARLRAEGRDTDPIEHLRGLDVPGLWIYGGQDRSLPVALSVSRLQALIDGGRRNFAYWLNSSANHDDFDNSRPFLGAVTTWMLERARLG